MQYRRTMLADPHDPDPGLSEHRRTCPECSLYTERLLHFESRLERALRVPVPAKGSAAGTDSAARADMALRSGRVVPFRRRPSQRPAAGRVPYRKGWLTMAASMLLAVVVAGGLWLSVPGPSLAADVVTHMKGEPQAWKRTDVPVPTTALQDVLRDSHLRLAAGAGVVSYARSCSFRGHQVPHLVIQTESGPVTVMVLVHEHVSKPMHFDEQGYRGVIVPVAGHGSLAVLTRGQTTDINAIRHIAARVLDSIVWTARVTPSPRGAFSYSNLTEQIDQPPRTRRQGGVIGFELNGDSFQSIGKRSVARRRRIGGSLDQAIDVPHQVA
jgi:hypothetical protein